MREGRGIVRHVSNRFVVVVCRREHTGMAVTYPELSARMGKTRQRLLAMPSCATGGGGMIRAIIGFIGFLVEVVGCALITILVTVLFVLVASAIL